MLLKDKIIKVPNFSLKRDINRWCDYIELVCLTCEDELITKDEMISIISGEGDDSGQEEHSDNFDKISADIELIFDHIRYRSETIDEFYPFDYDNSCLSVKYNFTEENIQYIILLLCSSIAFMDKSASTIITKYFEEYCLHIFSYFVSKDSEIYVFGTSRENTKFTGNLRSRIEILAKCFNSETTKSFDSDQQFDVSAGDEGIDLVAFNHIDEATHIPIALGQCTCSYLKWEIKQEEINQDAWTQKIIPIAPFGKYMFVSFFCRNTWGKFENPTTITTCLIDRLRILLTIRRHNEIFEKINALEQVSLIKECAGGELAQKIDDRWDKDGYQELS